MFISRVNSNITPFPRSNVFVVFNSVENTPVEPGAAPSPRPAFIPSREFTPVRQRPARSAGRRA